VSPSPAVLREATEADAEALVRIDKACVADGRGMVRVPGEGPADAARYAARAGFGQPGRIRYVAVVDGVVVGESSVVTTPWVQIGHVGMFAVQVHPDHQGLGIGRQLSEAAVAWAEQNGVLRLHLLVRADNRRAVALYEDLRFAIEATRRGFLRLPEGGFADDYVMVRFFGELAD